MWSVGPLSDTAVSHTWSVGPLSDTAVSHMWSVGPLTDITVSHMWSVGPLTDTAVSHMWSVGPLTDTAISHTGSVGPLTDTTGTVSGLMITVRWRCVRLVVLDVSKNLSAFTFSGQSVILMQIRQAVSILQHLRICLSLQRSLSCEGKKRTSHTPVKRKSSFLREEGGGEFWRHRKKKTNNRYSVRGFFPTAQAVRRRFSQRGPGFIVTAINAGFVVGKVARRLTAMAP